MYLHIKQSALNDFRMWLRQLSLTQTLTIIGFFDSTMEIQDCYMAFYSAYLRDYSFGENYIKENFYVFNDELQKDEMDDNALRSEFCYFAKHTNAMIHHVLNTLLEKQHYLPMSAKYFSTHWGYLQAELELYEKQPVLTTEHYNKKHSYFINKENLAKNLMALQALHRTYIDYHKTQATLPTVKKNWSFENEIYPPLSTEHYYSYAKLTHITPKEKAQSKILVANPKKRKYQPSLFANSLLENNNQQQQPSKTEELQTRIAVLESENAKLRQENNQWKKLFGHVEFIMTQRPDQYSHQEENNSVIPFPTGP